LPIQIILALQKPAYYFCLQPDDIPTSNIAAAPHFLLPITGKSNESPAAQAMIAELGLTGHLFTLDALHCQKNIRDCP